MGCGARLRKRRRPWGLRVERDPDLQVGGEVAWEIAPGSVGMDREQLGELHRCNRSVELFNLLLKGAIVVPWLIETEVIH